MKWLCILVGHKWLNLHLLSDPERFCIRCHTVQRLT